jgi:hypothetical protein
MPVTHTLTRERLDWHISLRLDRIHDYIRTNRRGVITSEVCNRYVASERANIFDTLFLMRFLATPPTRDS